jgi:hypothetical protein
MIVRIKFTICPLRDPICADRTASAIVKLLQISTSVLVPPSQTFSSWLLSAHASGYMWR